MHLVGESQALLGDRELAGAAVHLGVVDGDRRAHREALERLFVVAVEGAAVELVAEVEIAAKRRLGGDRHREQRLHRRMVGRKAGALRVPGEVGDAQRPAVVERDAEQAPSDRRRADRRALVGIDPRGEERNDAAGLVHHRERAVIRGDEHPGLVDDDLQHDLLRELGEDQQPGLTEGGELAVLALELRVKALDDVEDAAEQEERRDEGESVEQEVATPPGEVGEERMPGRLENQDERHRCREGDPLQPSDREADVERRSLRPEGTGGWAG